MRAVRFSEFGGPEVLRLEDVPLPEPGDGQVRVAVRVAGVNPVDWKIRSGLFGGALQRPRGLGQELAGVVDAVGPGVELSVGDEVFGWAVGGAYAEYALAGTVLPKPPGMSWQDAAALPVTGEAAVRGLRELAVVPPEVLLVHGASGAVGSLATQLAVHRGIQVIGTASEQALPYVESLGATPVRYGEGLVERVRAVTPKVDAAFDTTGRGVLVDSVDLTGSAARVLTIADPDATSHGVRFSGDATMTIEVLRELATTHEAGDLRIQHARSYRLEEVGEALALSETGHARGKITIEVG